ncbi:uncharacterized protein LOC129601892 isoform X2 [Paramacrobiotus metropolitanus]|uniref:uncharacterized protein LOC129601892 isoform X2 n=1 Tax=Paramacrobiotus metropolitanus TaxID=2943436 RepID=UPI0024457E7B|nr:uncharacterized protein LOC129601892 isoform X2 [Paramacrobiotus metropolitanus]
MPPQKLSLLLHPKSFSNSDRELFDRFNAAVECILRDENFRTFRWACDFPNVAKEEMGLNIVLPEKEPGQKDEGRMRTRGAAAAAATAAAQSKAAPSVDPNTSAEPKTAATKPRRTYKSRSKAASKSSTAVETVLASSPIPVFDVPDDAELQSLGMAYPSSTFLGFTDKRSVATPLAAQQCASLLTTSLTILDAQRRSQILQIMSSGKANEIRILERHCHLPELVSVVKFHKFDYDPDPAKCIVKADLDIFGYFNPKQRQYECLGRAYDQLIANSFVLVEKLMYMRIGADKLEITESQATIVESFAQKAFVFDESRFTFGTDGVRVPIFPPKLSVKGKVEDVRKSIARFSDVADSKQEFAPMQTVMSECNSLAYHIFIGLRSLTPLTSEAEAVSSVKWMVGQIFYDAFLKYFNVADPGAQSGSCLYPAVSIALTGNTDLHFHVRLGLLHVLAECLKRGELESGVAFLGITSISIARHAVADPLGPRPLNFHWGPLYLLATMLSRAIFVHDSTAGATSRRNPLQWSEDHTDEKLADILNESDKGQVFRSLAGEWEPLASEPLRLLYTGSKFYPVLPKSSGELHRFQPRDPHPLKQLQSGNQDRDADAPSTSADGE